MSKPTNSSVPLLCSICPKNPLFSDVSHLLTHIASKSHLAHQFKLKIRAQHEISASEQLDKFQEWYDSNDLGEKLSQRLNMKGNGKSSRRSRSSAKITKTEPESRTPILPPQPTTAQLFPFRAPMPVMQIWGNDEVPRYATPSMGRSIPNFPFRDSPDGSSKTTIETEETDDEDEEVDTLDSSKPKGIFWPGMGLFDSATPAMKRKRNQKKDASVLIAMKRSSRDTHAYETEYELKSPEWELKNVRDIFGPLSTDTSPVKAAYPPKRYNTRHKQTPLSTLSSNVSRSRRSFGKTRWETPKSRLRPNHARVLRSARKTGSPFNDYMDRRYEPSAEEDHEFKQAIEDIGNGKKIDAKRWGLFRSPDKVTASPSLTESPLEDHRFDFTHGYSTQPSIVVQDQITPTRVFKPVPTRSYEVESHSGQEAKPIMSTNDLFPMPYFHHNPYNPIFTPSVFPTPNYFGEAAHSDWKPTMDHGFHNNYQYQMGNHATNDHGDIFAPGY